MESPVYSLEILYAMGAALAIAGLWLGWLAGRRTSATAKKYQDVSQKLDQVMYLLVDNMTKTKYT